MDIYIGNLPSQVNSSDLKKVVNAVLLPNSFKELMQRLVNKKDRLTLSEFDVIDKQLGSSESRFAHAVILPDSAAQCVLRRMDHLTFQGKSLRVREYAQRNSTNERRGRPGRNLYAVKVYNRRLEDRRTKFNT